MIPKNTRPSHHFSTLHPPSVIPPSTQGLQERGLQDFKEIIINLALKLALCQISFAERGLISSFLFPSGNKSRLLFLLPLFLDDLKKRSWKRSLEYLVCVSAQGVSACAFSPRLLPGW